MSNLKNSKEVECCSMEQQQAVAHPSVHKYELKKQAVIAKTQLKTEHKVAKYEQKKKMKLEKERIKNEYTQQALRQMRGRNGGISGSSEAMEVSKSLNEMDLDKEAGIRESGRARSSSIEDDILSAKVQGYKLKKQMKADKKIDKKKFKYQQKAAEKVFKLQQKERKYGQFVPSTASAPVQSRIGEFVVVADKVDDENEELQVEGF
eukprot:CAMPEP_0174257120 /NCGR_PEP_ID=MMETSP0439-20130205/6282_1 /TAXON_ID=0 /ORGANISM="Stereomyxa ramosa, Strain Chinc5" /LENGTH=205 /DNA_ID=CAMNT_0015340051 /DNA_START=97 /DNA_END=714 /DNA_ORIENTATION=+